MDADGRLRNRTEIQIIETKWRKVNFEEIRRSHCKNAAIITMCANSGDQAIDNRRP